LPLKKIENLKRIKMKGIIKTLKAKPNKDIFWVAKKLGVTTLQVSVCQHEYIKQFRKA